MSLFTPNIAGPPAVKKLTLGQDVLLVQFARHYCDGCYVVQQAEVTLGGKALDKTRVRPPRNNLIPDWAHEALRAGFRPLNGLIDDLKSFPVGGLKTLTPTQLEDFVPAWYAAQEQLAAARTQVRQRWDEVEEWNEEGWRDFPIDYDREIGRRLRRIKANLDFLYAVEYYLWDPPRPSTAAVGSGQVQSWLQEGQANAEKAEDEAVAAFVVGPRADVVAAGQALILALNDADTKVLKPATFNPLRKAMHLVRGMQEIADPALLGQIAATDDLIQDVLEAAAASVLSATAVIKSRAQELTEAIERVIAAARDKAAAKSILQAFGKAGRVIELD